MAFPKMDVELLDKIYANKWLSDTEKEILIFKYKENLYNYQIAQRLNVSERTVIRMLKTIFRKIEPIILEHFAE